MTMVLFIDLAAQCAPQVPTELLAAIASVESGFQPLMVRGKVSTDVVRTAGEGVAVVVGRMDAGDDMTVGLMGLDALTLAADGLSYAEAFDACRNVEAAGRVIDSLWKAAEKMGMSPSKAERQAVRGYFQRSVARVGTVDAYEARVMAERSALRAGLPRLTLKGAAGQPKTIATQTSAAAKDVPREGQPSQSGVPVAVVALEKPAWDVYGGVSSSGLVAFSK
jgi:type IV secretion system protein VirB1